MWIWDGDTEAKEQGTYSSPLSVSLPLNRNLYECKIHTLRHLGSLAINAILYGTNIYYVIVRLLFFTVIVLLVSIPGS